MNQEFNPYKYLIYNIHTDRDEPQFKAWEDLPEKFRSRFKKAPNGGYVKAEAIEQIQLARFMAEAENIVRGNRERGLKQQIKKIDKKANLRSDIMAESFTAGRANS